MSIAGPGSLNKAMPTANVESADTESLLSAARRGDERAYLELVEGHRSELHAHCYRMLASLEDADDAVQEALTRAWRGLARFEARSSVRTWLFKIATNVSLDMARRRKRRAVPLLDGRQVGAGESPGEPLVDVPWIQPYPLAPVDAAMASPEARYELHEALELAFLSPFSICHHASAPYSSCARFSVTRPKRLQGCSTRRCRRSTPRCSGREAQRPRDFPARASKPSCARSARMASGS